MMLRKDPPIWHNLKIKERFLMKVAWPFQSIIPLNKTQIVQDLIIQQHLC